MRANIVVIALAALGIFFFREPILNYISFLEEKSSLGEFVSELPKVRQSDLDTLVKRSENEIQAPPPLRAKVEAPQTFLTPAGVIEWTNIQRQENGGLSALAENSELNAAAMAKLKDMFQGQYFEHVSPSGVGPAEVAKDAGYEFIAAGENLALGNFQNDKVLVQAWMDSPGHRANILGERFTEIGVAVGKGTFESRSTWLAVQEFGLPLSACPAPSSILKSQIESYETQAKILSQSIDVKRVEIESTHPKRGPEYRMKIDEYNVLVNEYNTLVDQTKSLISRYNQEVNSFNVCLQQFNV